MDPGSQGNADEAGPAGTLPILSVPFLTVSLPPFVLEVPRELEIIDGSLKSLGLQAAYSVLLKSCLP